MLTGGLDVIGVFAFGPSDMLTKSQGKLRQLVFSIQKTVHHKPASYFDDLIHSRIILQICSATKKYPDVYKIFNMSLKMFGISYLLPGFN